MTADEWIKLRVADPPCVIIVRGRDGISWDVVLRLATGLQDRETALELAHDRQTELIGAASRYPPTGDVQTWVTYGPDGAAKEPA